MLELASLGAAPANAPEDVQSSADVIVKDNGHSAVADLIDRYLMN